MNINCAVLVVVSLPDTIGNCMSSKCILSSHLPRTCDTVIDFHSTILASF